MQQPSAPTSSANDPQSCYTTCGAKVISCLEKLHAKPTSPAEALFDFAHGSLLSMGFKAFCTRTNDFCAEDKLPQFGAGGAQGFEQRYRYIGHGFGAPSQRETGQPLGAAQKQQERLAGAESDYKADTKAVGEQGQQQSQQQQQQQQQGGQMEERRGGGAVMPAERHSLAREEASLDVILYGTPQGNEGLMLRVCDSAGAAKSHGHEERGTYAGGGSYSMSSYAYSSATQGKSGTGELFKYADWLNDCCVQNAGAGCDMRKCIRDPSALCQRLNETILHDLIPDKPPQVHAATNLFHSFFGRSAVPRLGLF